MNNLIKEYVQLCLLEEAASLSFRGSGISAESVKKDLHRYIERLSQKFEGKKEVDVPIAKPSSAPAGAIIVDSFSGQSKGKPAVISDVSMGESVTLVLKNLEWIIYEFEGRTGTIWGAAVKDKNGNYVRVDSLQKSGFFDTGKANVLQKQGLQEEGLNKSLKEILLESGSDYAYLSIGSRESMPRIFDVKAISGTPKADVEVIGVTREESVFLSLKDGTTVKDFQQYGGITPFKDFPEVLEFAYKVWNLTTPDPNEKNRRILSFSEIYSTKVSKKLVLATVYGPDAAKKGSNFGPQKCDMLLQGTPDSVTFVKIGSKGKIPVVELVGNGHALVYPELPEEDFTPVLYARRDNSTTLTGFGPFTKNQGVRFLCYPQGKMTRKAVDIETALAQTWNKVPADVGEKAYKQPITSTQKVKVTVK